MRKSNYIRYWTDPIVRRCLTDNPTIRVADIQRQAASQGLKIAHSYISDLRKAFLAEQGKQETA